MSSDIEMANDVSNTSSTFSLGRGGDSALHDKQPAAAVNPNAGPTFRVYKNIGLFPVPTSAAAATNFYCHCNNYKCKSRDESPLPAHDYYYVDMLVEKLMKAYTELDVGTAATIWVTDKPLAQFGCCVVSPSVEACDLLGLLVGEGLPCTLMVLGVMSVYNRIDVKGSVTKLLYNSSSPLYHSVQVWYMQQEEDKEDLVFELSSPLTDNYHALLLAVTEGMESTLLTEYMTWPAFIAKYETKPVPRKLSEAESVMMWEMLREFYVRRQQQPMTRKGSSSKEEVVCCKQKLGGGSSEIQEKEWVTWTVRPFNRAPAFSGSVVVNSELSARVCLEVYFRLQPGRYCCSYIEDKRSRDMLRTTRLTHSQIMDAIGEIRKWLNSIYN